MRAQTEKQNLAKFDTFKWVVIGILLAAGVVANQYYSEQVAVAIRLIAWLLLVMAVLGIASQTNKGRLAWSFAKEARIELRKVIWPSRQETVQVTLIVMVMVIVMAFFLWGVDTALIWIMSLLTGQRG